jgi:hypothetical protein
MQRWKRAVERHNQKLGIAPTEAEPANELSTVSQRERSRAPPAAVRPLPGQAQRGARARWPPGTDDRPPSTTSAAVETAASTAPVLNDAGAGAVFGGGKGEEMFRRRFQTIEASTGPEPGPRPSVRKPPVNPGPTQDAARDRVTEEQPLPAGTTFIRKFQAFATDNELGGTALQTASAAPMRPGELRAAASTESPAGPPPRAPSVARPAPALAAGNAAPELQRLGTEAVAAAAPAAALPTDDTGRPVSTPANPDASNAAAGERTVPPPPLSASDTGAGASGVQQEAHDPGRTADAKPEHMDEARQEAATRTRDTSHASADGRTPLHVAQIRAELEEARREHRLLLKKLSGIEKERDSVRAERAQLHSERSALARDRDALIARVMRLRQLIRREAALAENVPRHTGSVRHGAGRYRDPLARNACSDEERSRARSRRAPERHRRERRRRRALNDSLREVGVRFGRWWRKLFIAPRTLDSDASAASRYDDSDASAAYVSADDACSGARIGRHQRRHRQQQQQQQQRASRAVPDFPPRDRQRRQRRALRSESAVAARGTALDDTEAAAAHGRVMALQRRHAWKRASGGLHARRARAAPPGTVATDAEDDSEQMDASSADEEHDAYEQPPKSALLELEQQLRSLVHRLEAMDTVLVTEDDAQLAGDRGRADLAASVASGKLAAEPKPTAARAAAPIDAVSADGPFVIRRRNPHVHSGIRGVSRPMRRPMSPAAAKRQSMRRTGNPAAVVEVTGPRQALRAARRASAAPARSRLAAAEALLSDSDALDSDVIDPVASDAYSEPLETVDAYRDRDISQGDSLLYPNADW